MSIFSPADILIPKASMRERFAVVACDQYTSQPEYWKSVTRAVGDAPSALKIIVPESELSNVDVDVQMNVRIQKVNTEMDRYLSGNVFDTINNSFIYVERTLDSKKIRRGVLGKIDLCAYDYAKKSTSLVRATEATVLERIPPRVAVREGASLESPHVMVLIDDPQDSLISGLRARRDTFDKLYGFELMMGGGTIEGWRVNEKGAAHVATALDTLVNPAAFAARYGEKKAPLIFAVGDGNHSLATAKECYMRLCKKYGAAAMENHPARYALVEVVNLHDPALEFEPIHRVVFDIDRVHFAGKMEDALSTDVSESEQQFVMLKNGNKQNVCIGAPSAGMAVGSLQHFIDEYTNEFGGRCDYIHGDDVIAQLSGKPDTLGFMLPPIDKSLLFKTVILDGSLTRKTFSMGNACDKRYYLECRMIRE